MRIKRFIAYRVFELRYLFGWKLRRKIKILTAEETIHEICSKHLSVVRFGNCELEMLAGLGDHAGNFQSISKGLVEDMMASLQAPSESVLVCLPGRMARELPHAPTQASWWKHWIVRCYGGVLSKLQKDLVYGDASFTRFYMDFIKDSTCVNYLWNVYLPSIQQIWDGQRILVVEGESSKLGVYSGVLNSGRIVKRILCPNKEAYEWKNEIMDAIISNSPHFDVVLLCLGPTATIIASELTRSHGLWCIDLGHVEVEFLWLKYHCQSKAVFDGLNSAEGRTENGVISLPAYDENKYNSEIISRIGV